MKKPSIAIKLNPRDYTGLISLGNRVSSSVSGNLALPTPSPTVLVLQAAVTATETALTARGDVHNHGSSSAVAELRQAAKTLHQLLTAMAEYVTNTAQLAAGNDYVAMAIIMISSGFGLSNNPNPQGLLQAVRNLRRVSDPSLNENEVKETWEQPENVTSKNNVKSYLVFRGTTSVFSAAVQIATTSRAEFIDTNNTGAMVTWYYWIVPFGAAGNGAVSSVLVVTLPAI